MTRLLLVADPGGHLAVLDWARSRVGPGDLTWVTLDTPDARDRLRGERVIHGHGPTARSPSALLRNLALARRVIAAVRPDRVVSTGAALGVPFLWWASAQGIATCFLEVVDRVSTPSLTGRLVRPVVDELWVQLDTQRAAYPRATVIGRLSPAPRPPRVRGDQIFVAFGTHTRRFERLVVACERLAGAGKRVVVQHGHSRAPAGCEVRPFMGHRAFLEALDTAGTVVLHGGTSSLAEAEAGGARPWVVARERAHGEHVDDHQRGNIGVDRLVERVLAGDQPPASV